MARSLGGDFHLCAAEPRRQEVTWGIPGIIEAAGDVAGLWTGVRCPGETCTLSLCVPPFYSGSCNVIGQVALLLFFPFQLRLLATRESQPWGEIHLRNVCWLRHQAEKRCWLVCRSETCLAAQAGALTAPCMSVPCQTLWLPRLPGWSVSSRNKRGGDRFA